MVAKVSFLGYAGPLLWGSMARQYIRKENCLLELRRGAGRDQSGPQHPAEGHNLSDPVFF